MSISIVLICSQHLTNKKVTFNAELWKLNCLSTKATEIWKEMLWNSKCYNFLLMWHIVDIDLKIFVRTSGIKIVCFQQQVLFYKLKIFIPSNTATTRLSKNMQRTVHCIGIIYLLRVIICLDACMCNSSFSVSYCYTLITIKGQSKHVVCCRPSLKPNAWPSDNSPYCTQVIKTPTYGVKCRHCCQPKKSTSGSSQDFCKCPWIHKFCSLHTKMKIILLLIDLLVTSEDSSFSSEETQTMRRNGEFFRKIKKNGLKTILISLSLICNSYKIIIFILNCVFFLINVFKVDIN